MNIYSGYDLRKEIYSSNYKRSNSYDVWKSPSNRLSYFLMKTIQLQDQDLSMVKTEASIIHWLSHDKKYGTQFLLPYMNSADDLKLYFLFLVSKVMLFVIHWIQRPYCH